jgi:hypothetical protein
MASLVTTTINGTLTGNSSATFDSNIRSKTQLQVSNDYSINYFYKTDNTTMLGYLLMRDNNNSFLSFPAAQDFRFLHGNTNRIAVKHTDGNVGIGTTNPNASLHIDKAVPSIILETESNSGDPIITLKSSGPITGEGAQLWYDNSVGTLHIQTTYPNNAADIVFHTATGADKGTGNVRMVITGDGKVGIGTTNPSTKLEIVGETKSTNYRFSGPSDGGAVPAYSNSNYSTVKYNEAQRATELVSSTDDDIGMAFPAFRVNESAGEQWKLWVQYKASASTSSGFYARVYEYNAELPDGKIAVSSSATNPVVQEDTSGRTDWKTNVAISTTWVTSTYTYTPTAGAKWASIVLLNWTGMGYNSLYARVGKERFFGTSSVITGSGTINKLPLWNGTSSLGDSRVSQTSSSIEILGASGQGYSRLLLKPDTGANLSLLELSHGPDPNNAGVVVFGRGDSSYATINSLSRGTGVTKVINFDIDSDEKMRIDTDGNVGINSTDPQRLLDVSASGQITFGDQVSSGTSDNKQGIYWHTSDSYAIFRSSGSWSSPNYQQLMLNWSTGIVLNPGSGTYGKSHVGVVGGVSIGDSYYTTKYDNGLIVQGNVGIGTTNPGNYKLKVVGETHSTHFITGYDWTAKTGGLHIGNDGLTTGAVSFYNGISGSSANIYRNSDILYVGARAGVNTRGLAIDVNGNVGLGTAIPANKFHINIGTNLNWIFGYPSNTTTSLAALNDAESAYVDARIDGLTLALNSQSGGNVGINTTSPNSLLDVSASAPIVTLNSTKDGSWTASEAVGTINFRTSDSSGSGAGTIASIKAVAQDTTTLPNGALAFSTGATSGFAERMRIDNDGKVGISTTDPECKLDIHDHTSATTFIADNNAGVRITNWGGATGWSLLGFGGFSSSYPKNLSQIGSLSTNSGTYLAFGTSNNYGTGITNQAMTIDPSGNVGIGTTGPNSRLDVRSTSAFTNGVAYVEQGLATNLPTLLVNQTVSGGNQNVDQGLVVKAVGASDGSGNTLHAYQRDGSTTGLVVKGSGRVGIGTVTPGYPLHVVGKIYSSTEGQFGNTVVKNNSGVATFGSNSTATTIKINLDASASRNDLVIKGSTGNVGIGTANPLFKLHVNGDIYQEAGYSIYSNANRGWYRGNYTTTGSGVSNGKIVTLNPAHGQTASSNYHYIFELTTIGTSTDSGATYIGVYSANTSAWSLRAVSLSGGSSNHPQLSVSGNNFTVYTNHSSNYTVVVSVTSVYNGDADSTAHSLGANYQWQRAVNDLYYNDGLVGIGTGTPSQKLHVQGNLRLTGAFYDSNNVAGVSGQVLTSTGSATDWKSISDISDTVTGSGTTNYVTKWSNGANSDLTNSLIYDNGTNVGISTNSPQGKLHINTEAAQANHVYINGEVNQDKLLYFRHYANSEGAGNNAYVGYIGSKGVDNLLSLGHLNTSRKNVTKTKVTENSNEGIGKTNKNTKQDARGSVSKREKTNRPIYDGN